MTVLYHLLERDNDRDYQVTKDPVLPRGVSFKRGALITAPLPDPLELEVDFPAGPLPHLLGTGVPVISERLRTTLLSAGVDNFQVRHVLKSHADARMAVFRYIEGWYNPHRRHSGLDYQSPINYEKKHEVAA